MEIIRNDIVMIQQQLVQMSGDGALELSRPRDYCDLLLGHSLEEFVSFVQRYPDTHPMEDYEHLLALIFTKQKNEANKSSSALLGDSAQSFGNLRERIQRTLPNVLKKQ
jgi:hypothetical protein